MPTSYQSGGARVNTPPQFPTPSSPARSPEREPVALTKRDLPRDTATFVPYYWEAYNEMVQPRRFDWYLIRRWLKDLGPLGFTIVKTLRNRCYHNPVQGVLRDECEVDMDELAAEIGVGRATLFREFKSNATLAHFVRRQRQYAVKDGRWYKDANIYQVCMDDPIHPDDMQAYDDLRAVKEQERAEAEEARQQQQEGNGKPPPPRVKNSQNSENLDHSRKSHFETYGLDGQNVTGNRKSQNETYTADDDIRKSQNETTLMSSQIETTPMSSQIETTPMSSQIETTPMSSQIETTPMSSQIETTPMSSQNDTTLVDLPSGGLLTKGSLTHLGASPVINNDPKGVAENEQKSSPLIQVWNKILPSLEAKMTKPTFHTHIESLLPVSMAPVEDGGVEIILNCPSAFTREWVDKRHVPAIAMALSAELACAVTVRLVQLPKETHRG